MLIQYKAEGIHLVGISEDGTALVGFEGLQAFESSKPTQRSRIGITSIHEVSDIPDFQFDHNMRPMLQAFIVLTDKVSNRRSICQNAVFLLFEN